MQVDFVKGHCGWDTLTLLLDGQVPPEQELTAALKIIGAPVYGGLEVGFLGLADGPGRIRVRMVDSTSRDWIPMCGGMTQVIGKALVETSFRDYFGVDIDAPRVTCDLLTESGVIPICIELDNRRANRITTTMDGFASYLYRQGIEPMILEDCEVLRVGHHLVMDITALQRTHPGVDFTRRDGGRHLDIVNGILKTFKRHGGWKEGVVGMLFDNRPEGPGQFRVYPRFYNHDLAAASIPYEFQCGTGSVSVALALLHHRLIAPTSAGQGMRVVFEWGSQRATRDPYGIRTSDVDIVVRDDRVAGISFHHSVVEIVAEGRLTLPGY